MTENSPAYRRGFIHGLRAAGADPALIRETEEQHAALRAAEQHAAQLARDAQAAVLTYDGGPL